jgi:uncharacterized Zn finger protein
MSPSRYFQWPESSGPIPVDGGVKARSKRGAIGEQWWSQRFIAVLESWGMSGRLQRGRNYARRGQVIEFKLTQGKVTARVQGSRPQPYTVSIRVLPLTTAQWRTVQRRLASQALFRAKLLSGEMPAEIEEVFAQCGTPLFPRSPADLDMHCSCPDWEVPCKHLAAVCYVLAEAFDDDPFQMLAWRGKARADLLAALRQGTQRQGTPGEGTPRQGTQRQGTQRQGTQRDAAGSAAVSAAPVPAAGQAPGASGALADVPGAPLERLLADFWSPGISQARLRALATPAPATIVPDLLLRMSDPPAVTVRGKDLRDILAPAYDRLASDDELHDATLGASANAGG